MLEAKSAHRLANKHARNWNKMGYEIGLFGGLVIKKLLRSNRTCVSTDTVVSDWRSSCNVLILNQEGRTTGLIRTFKCTVFSENSTLCTSFE